MIQHDQRHCPTCQRPTLHVRNRYDMPHTGYLVVWAFACLVAIVAPRTFWALFCGPLVVILPVAWFVHGLINLLVAGPAYRCATCGSATGQSAAVADEQERLRRALAKAAERRGAAG